jgi:FemAB-related protein (PEP-CTERM system-associated)
MHTLNREREVARPMQISEQVAAADWDAFVAQQPDATGYHLSGWRTVFERGLKHRTHYLAAQSENGLEGVLPLVEVRSRLFGRVLSSLPYVNYGGVLGGAEASAALLDAARDIARRRGLDHVLFRHRSRVFPALPVRTHKVTMLLPLKDSADAMWNALDRKVRNQVRKAEKSDLTLSSGGMELLDEFYGVFARNMRDLGTPVYGRPLFAAMLDAFPSSARIHTVSHGGRTIAGAVSYEYGDTIEVPSASSLRESRALCPNHLMYWAIIKDACTRGLRVFDFGRSTPNDGTYQFKQQWGAIEEPLAWEYAMRGGGQVPADDRHSSKYRASIEVWKRLPLGFASWVGPRVARLVP